MTGAIDMGSIQIPKLFSEIHALTKNLASSVAEIACEYQVDQDIGTTFWQSIGTFYKSPADVLPVGQGNKKAISYRFRALSQVSTTPALMTAAAIKAVGRTPVKRQWNIRIRSGSFQVDALGIPDADPDDFYLWLQQASQTASPLHMNARWKSMHNVKVYAEAPALRREYSTPDGKWGALYNITLREI